MRPAPLPGENKFSKLLTQKPLTTAMVMLSAIAIVTLSGVILVSRPNSPGSTITDNGKQSIVTEKSELNPVSGKYVKVDLPEGWTLKEYENGQGNDLKITGFQDPAFKYSGVTEISIFNSENKSVFSIKAMGGIGLSPCGILYKYSDTDVGYLNSQIIDEDNGQKTQVIDRSAANDPEFNLFGKRYRRVETTLVMAVPNMPNKFNPVCTNIGWVSYTEQLGFKLESVDNAASTYPTAYTYAIAIEPKINAGDLGMLDKVLKTFKPIEKPSNEIKTITFQEPSFRDFSFQYDTSWKIEVKKFGQENSLGFVSDYTPECTKDDCAGIRMTKGFVKLDMVFNIALDDTGWVCRNDENHWVKVGKNWTRFDSTYPASGLEGESEDFDFIYSLGTYYNATITKGVIQDANGYFVPGNAPEATQTYLMCDEAGVFFSFKETQPTLGDALRANKPRLYFTGEPDTRMLQEVDKMMQSISYPGRLTN